MSKKTYELCIIGEIHCDECNDIIHNHIEECPICKGQYTETDEYYELDYGAEIDCLSCKSKFRHVGGCVYGGTDSIWELVEN